MAYMIRAQFTRMDTTFLLQFMQASMLFRIAPCNKGLVMEHSTHLSTQLLFKDPRQIIGGLNQPIQT